ncbi:MAG: hypothetical protein IJD64_01970 [Clostridia bacterium]|nr:hypothetical protein [Clostridia bacterium]
MTIAKVFFKLTIFVLLVTVLLPSLLACTTDNQEEPPFELLEESSDKESYSLYRIVLSATCSSELFCAAQNFKERLSKQTGVPCDLVYDTEQVTQTKNIVEILLGNTIRTASKKAMMDFRENDYLCQLQDTVLVLGGRSDEATLAALDRFYDELLEHATAQSILPKEAGFLYRANYPIETITIGGFDLALFDIVYEKDTSESMLVLAKTLQEKIRTDTAYYLDLQSEAEFHETSKRIYLTHSEKVPTGVAHICFDAQGVVLSAKDLFGISVAVKEFYQQLLASVETSDRFGTSNTITTVNYEKNELALASIWIDPTKDTVSELIRMNDLVKSTSPDLIFSRNMSETQRALFYEMIDDQYHTAAEIEFLKADVDWRLLDNLGPTATLYQIGNDANGFLLLSVGDTPTEKLLADLPKKDLPLLIVADLSCDEMWENDCFDRVLFSASEQVSFSLWAEPNSFLVIEAMSQDGYRILSVERVSAF